MGGRIDVQSVVGKGSVFRLCIKIQKGEYIPNVSSEDIHPKNMIENHSRAALLSSSLPASSCTLAFSQLSDTDPSSASSSLLSSASSSASTPVLSSLSLPLDGRHELHIAPDGPAHPELRFLVVDDSMLNRKLLVHHLRKLNLECDTAENGLQAILAVQNFPTYAAIFMDMSMPVMDGYRATSQLRDMGFSTPIFALTG